MILVFLQKGLQKQLYMSLVLSAGYEYPKRPHVSCSSGSGTTERKTGPPPDATSFPAGAHWSRFAGVDFPAVGQSRTSRSQRRTRTLTDQGPAAVS